MIKSKSAEELKKLSDELKSKQNLVKSAKEQLQSSN